MAEKYGSIAGKDVYVYDLKIFKPFYHEDRKQDFIYSKTFRTGDILIYKNKNDAKYTKDENNNLICKLYYF